MQVHTVTRQHPLTTIAAAAGVSVLNAKQEAAERATRIATLDDRMVGTTLANEVMAHARLGVNIWRGFAMRLIGMTAEARAAFLNAIKADKGAITKAAVEFGINDKTAKKRTASFAVQVSELSTIASAFNGAASVTGWREYINAEMPAAARIDNDADMLEHGGYRTLVDYARTFSKAKAGRTADTWTAKLGKWLERNPVGDDASKAELAAFDAIVKVYNGLSA